MQSETAFQGQRARGLEGDGYTFWAQSESQDHAILQLTAQTETHEIDVIGAYSLWPQRC